MDAKAVIGEFAVAAQSAAAVLAQSPGHQRDAALRACAAAIRDKKDILSYTYTDPMKEVDPSLVQVEGTWKP